MNSTLMTAAALLQSPGFRLQLRPQQLVSSQHQLQMMIGSRWGARTGNNHGFVQKPVVQATLWPDSTGGGRNNNPTPSSDVVQEFYSSLNEKDSKRLEKLIAPDCIIHDNAYYEPLDNKSTKTYFTRLMVAMGKNVKFAIDDVSQGVEPAVAVMWHLEWNGKIIPFTKGCSFYICSGKGATPNFIRRVHIFQESPVKPSKLALEILNIVTNLFDTFPDIAEGFLKNPEEAIQPFLRFFKFYIEPFIIPFLAYYTHLWTYLSKGLAMVLSMLYTIIKWFV